MALTALTSFSPDFFHGEGEPYDAIALNSKKQPISLYAAIETLEEPARSEIAEYLGILPDNEGFASEVLDLARLTDTCEDDGRSVEVWLDPEGDIRVTVYSADR